MNIKNKIGIFGQDLAKDFLQQREYQILTENYYTQAGEIDIICQKDEQLVFIEVKTRTSQEFGIPEQAIDKNKKEKLHKTALNYLQENKISQENWRIDCIAIEINKDTKTAKIRHHKNIY